MQNQSWRNRVVIDLDALRHNAARVRALCPDSRILAVVKANAYGHGIEHVGPALAARVDGFAVARLQEGIRCRRLVERRIVVLSDFTGAAQLPCFAAHRLDVTLYSAEQLAWLRSYSGPGLSVWLKMDSGMNRLGLPAVLFAQALDMLRQHGSVNEIFALSHLACADDLDHPATGQQLERFAAATAATAFSAVPRSLSNSAGVCGWPAAHYDWVRPGLMLYGASPIKQYSTADLRLRPVMSLQAGLFAIKSVGAGQPVGYGGSFVTTRPTVLGLVSAGYGDGYPRRLADGAYALLRGQAVPIVGRVSMDMLAVDISAVAAARLGDAVCLWGAQPEVEQVAAWSDTVAYELLCGVAERVPRVVRGELHG